MTVCGLTDDPGKWYLCKLNDPNREQTYKSGGWLGWKKGVNGARYEEMARKPGIVTGNGLPQLSRTEKLEPSVGGVQASSRSVLRVSLSLSLTLSLIIFLQPSYSFSFVATRTKMAAVCRKPVNEEGKEYW